MKTVLHYVDKTFGYVDKALNGFLMFLMAAIVVVVTWQVVTRFLMTQPSSYTEELARFCLIWIAILGSAYAFRTGAHLGLDLLTEKLEAVAKRRTAIVANLLCFAFAASIMVYGGLKLMLLTLELNQTSSSLGIKMGYVYAVVPLSGALICLYALKNCFNPDPHEVASPDAAPLDLDR